MADAVGLPDTTVWLWILRVVGAGIAMLIGWIIVGAANAKQISATMMGMMAIISNLLLVLCVVFGAIAVVMIFVKDAGWLYQRLYSHLSGAVTVALFSILPLCLLLMFFRATRTLGGIGLYLLTFFFGFSLWLYALMIAGSHGPGWVIGGLLACGVGVILSALIASAVWGQWSVAGGLLLAALLIWGARALGLAIAAKQMVKDEETQTDIT